MKKSKFIQFGRLEIWWNGTPKEFSVKNVFGCDCRMISIWSIGITILGKECKS